MDEIANWLYDLLSKKGEKDVQGIVRAIHNRCNDWFNVLQRRWPQHKDRHGSVEALLRSRPMMFRYIIVRPTNIPERFPESEEEEPPKLKRSQGHSRRTPAAPSWTSAAWNRQVKGISTASEFWTGVKPKSCELSRRKIAQSRARALFERGDDITARTCRAGGPPEKPGGLHARIVCGR